MLTHTRIERKLLTLYKTHIGGNTNMISEREDGCFYMVCTKQSFMDAAHAIFVTRAEALRYILLKGLRAKGAYITLF